MEADAINNDWTQNAERHDARNFKFLRSLKMKSESDEHTMTCNQRGQVMKYLVAGLLLSVAATAQAQIATKGLILDLDADKGIEVEDGDRVVKWTNQVAAFPASDFVKQDKGRKEPGSGRPPTGYGHPGSFSGT